MHPIINTVHIHSSPANVWAYLTDPGLMKKWMGEPEMDLEVITDWSVGHPIIVRGFHHAKFENKGMVLKYEPHNIIQYTHLSSISRLKDLPENYTTITFKLKPEGAHTILKTEVTGFANDSIYKHLNLYWLTTPGVIKRLVEQ